MSRVVGHRVTAIEVFAVARSIPEALALEAALKRVPQPEAFEPVAQVDDEQGEPVDDQHGDTAGIEPPPELTPEQEARLAATDPPEPLDVLNVEKANEPCSYGDGS